MRGMLLTLTYFAGLATSVLQAGIVGWRADGTGQFSDASVPLYWDKAEHVVWKTPTPKWSNASPIIVGDRIFICAEPDSLLCLSKQTGEILWQRSNSYVDIAAEDGKEETRKNMAQVDASKKQLRDIQGKRKQLAKQAKENPEDAAVQAELDAATVEETRWRDALNAVQDYVVPETHGANGYSSSTPTSDGTRVYMVFGTGVVVAYDMEGNRLWGRVIEKPNHGWGHSASPVLSDGRLVIHVRDVHGLDPASGETVWRAKSGARWGASVSTVIDGHGVVITANGEIIRAKDGLVLASGLHGLEYCAPLVHDGVVYFIEHGGKAFRLPAKADGTEKPELLWKTEPPKERYYASPLYHDGLIYCINQQRVYSVIDAKTGVVLKSDVIASLRQTVYPSLAWVGSRVFLGAEGGTVVFLEPGVEMKEVAASAIGSFRTCPAFEKDRVYIRTLDSLYCLRP